MAIISTAQKLCRGWCLFLRKRMIAFLLTVSALICPVMAAEEETPGTSAKAMILIHKDSGRVLCEENADSPMLIASTTKIMTALLAAERLDPDREVLIETDWTRVEGSSMYLRPGTSYTVRELLYGLMLASGNDAALALACTVAGSPEAFAELMNQRAEELGLKNTHFTNPHGLDDREHYSSARDLAIIMAEAMENELFAQVVSARSFSSHGATYVNHNKLLWRCPGVNGGKTGYTKAAGRCLVTTCQRDGLALICVTLSDGNDWLDHIALYDWAYGEYTALIYPGDIAVACVPVIGGQKSSVEAIPGEDVLLCVPKKCSVETVLYLPRFVYATGNHVSEAGEMRVYENGEQTGSWPLYWEQRIEPEKGMGPSLIKRLGQGILGIYY